MIYIVLPLALLVVIVALIAFARAVRGGQFDDLDTPAVRMLHDDEVQRGGADGDRARSRSPRRRRDRRHH